MAVLWKITWILPFRSAMTMGEKGVRTLDECNYLKERLDDQINWYSKKSQSCQKKYKVLKRIEMALAATIPVLTSVAIGLNSYQMIMSSTIGLFGACIAVLEGFISLGKYHENWIEYRSVCETLKKEKYMYLTKTGIYREGDAEETTFTTLVERTESIISNENVNWASLNSNDEGGK
ncbi:MAG: DUF4231 domain-containing protein [Sporolactobacillus sp.]